MAVNGRLTLKSATTISLHERFTSLRNIKPVPATGPTENNSGPLNSRSRSQIQKPRPASPDVYYVPPSQTGEAEVGVVKEAAETETGASTKNQKYPRKSSIAN